MCATVHQNHDFGVLLYCREKGYLNYLIIPITEEKLLFCHFPRLILKDTCMCESVPEACTHLVSQYCGRGHSCVVTGSV